MAKSFITVDSDNCKGCELCVSVCPKKVIEIDKTTINARGIHPAAAMKPDECIGCASCAVMCPDGVITIEKEV